MSFASRFAGLFLVGTGVIGLILCVVGLFVHTMLIGDAERAIDRRLQVTANALTTTSAGLRSAESSLLQADTSMKAIENTLGSVSQIITDTLPTMDTLSTVVGTDMPRTIQTTQEALQSAQSTALIIDQLLGAMSGLGIITLQVYNPKVPLNTAIAQVSDSLKPLPPAMQTIHTSLKSSSGSMIRIQKDTVQMRQSMHSINESMQAAQTTIKSYRSTIASLETELKTTREALPRWFMIARWVGIFVLLWLGAAQVGLITQGYELMQRSKRNVSQEHGNIP